MADTVPQVGLATPLSFVTVWVMLIARKWRVLNSRRLPTRRGCRVRNQKEARPVAERLSDIGIQRELGGLPGWSRRGDSLTKTYRFPTFPASITFVTRVADVAESMDHHPDIDIRHTRLTFTLSSHDVGGITTSDLALAREIERLAVESGI